MRHKIALPAFTVLELLVAISIVGVLVALLLPAIMWAREASRRTQCVDHLRQIGLALHEHHESTKRLPNSWKQAPDRLSGYGWAINLLPYLDEAPLRQTIHDNLPISASQNNSARESEISLMRCPSDISEPMFDLLAEAHEMPNEEGATTGSTESETPGASLVRLPTANYAGVFGTVEADDSFPAPRGDGAIVSDCRVRLDDLQRGLSHTILIGERTMAMVPSTWLGVNFRGEDAACRLVGSAMTSPNCDFCDECEFTSRHPDGANFVWADGHVSLISREIDPQEYRLLAKRRMN